MDVDTLEVLYQTMATCGQNLMRTGRTGLVLLPVEAEIDKMKKFLIVMGVVADDIFLLFSDLLRPTKDQRLILSVFVQTRPATCHRRTIGIRQPDARGGFGKRPLQNTREFLQVLLCVSSRDKRCPIALD